MSAPIFDFLIVGQGLAGTTLAFNLLASHYKVKILDPSFHKSSSIVSSGIINPMIGRRLSVSSQFFDQYKIAEQFYKEIEIKLNQNLFKPVIQKRWLLNSEIQSYAQKRLLDYSQLFKPISKNQIEIHSSAILDAKNFLLGSQSYFLKHNYLEHGFLDYEQLSLKKDLLSYKGLHFKKIIFCEGFQNINNPFFKHGRFELSLGSLMSVECKDLEPKIYNWGQWLAPQINLKHHFNLGASYHWDLNTEPNTDYEFSWLKAKMPKALSTTSMNLKEHKWGIRPTTKDRDVIIEPSPVDSRLWIFNGFGSKGALQTPYYAQELVNQFKTEIQ